MCHLAPNGASRHQVALSRTFWCQLALANSTWRHPAPSTSQYNWPHLVLSGLTPHYMAPLAPLRATRRHPVPSGTTRQTQRPLTIQRHLAPLNTNPHHSAQPGVIPCHLEPSNNTRRYLAQPGAIWHHPALTAPPGSILHPLPTPDDTQHHLAPPGATLRHLAPPGATSGGPTLLQYSTVTKN